MSLSTALAGFDFAAPLAFLALPAPLLLPLLARRLPRARRAPAGAILTPRALAERFSGAAGADARRTVAPAKILAALAWAALVVALAGPRSLSAAPATPVSGRDIMLTLDLSGSMAAEDFEIDGRPASRVDALKKVGAELIARRAGDRVGLVVFAEKAYAAAPLSFDVDAVARTLRDTPLGIVGHSTAIGEGLGLALRRLSQSSAPSRVIVLLSDGSNDAGTTDPNEVARLAAALGVRVYTIGMGVIDTKTFNGLGDPVDFEALQKLAAIGGGEAFRAKDTAGLEAASRAIEALVVGEAGVSAGVERRALWPWPAAFAFLATAGFALTRGRGAGFAPS